MEHSFVNIVAPIQLKQVSPLRAQIGALLDNPANEKASAAFGAMNGEEGIHFASLHALLGSDARRGHLLLEFTTDGDADAAIRRLADAATDLLEPIFAQAIDWRDGNDLGDYMIRHSVTNGFGYFDNAGINHDGTPGMSVGRIRREASLRRHVEKLFAAEPISSRGIEQIRSVRAQLQADEDWKWTFDLPEPVSHKATKRVAGITRIGSVALSFVKTYMWPLLLVVAGYALFAASREVAWEPALYAARMAALKGVIVAIGITLIVLGILYVLLRRAEKRDWTSDRVIARDELREVLKRENHYTQNHMISQSVLKPGFMRRCVVKLAMFAIGTLTALNGRPGFLDRIGTIHFARWITIPGTRDYIFLSNYDGSWESYLEDFITKAHQGLTAAWSCSIGFPRSENLFQKGATDGERFKRFARHSMIHTPFWYSAYPDISTDQVRDNAKIRRALVLAESDEEATALLSLFGSAVRPAELLEANQIQTIVFGGLGNMPFGSCLLFDLPGDRAQAKAWLDEVRRHIAYSDGRKIAKPWVITLGFGPQGLGKLGLPGHAINSFQAAFTEGMIAPGRERILGDPDAKGREAEWWWGEKETPDAAVLLYAESDDARNAGIAELAQLSKAHRTRLVHQIDLAKVPKEDQDRKEPFGFVDGISQPLIKGTYRATRNPDDRLNIVEPGEFILGYPDNHGNFPPIPRMIARRDPERGLPIGDGGWDFDQPIEGDMRDIGRNGSYLVIRQLQQHVKEFKSYCEQAAGQTNRAQTPGYQVDADWIAAKMVGRWPDGSPLVRWPYESETSYRQEQGDADPYRSQSPIKIKPANDFRFGTEDPQAVRCPFGSHIRRTNPRESQLPGVDEQIDITNRHRILRIGRVYEPSADSKNEGLLFMCLNGDIERQFEFIQQTWANSGHFHGLDREADPLISANGEFSHYTIPTRNGPMRLTGLPKFVTTRGGGYFFLPGRALVDYLARR